MGATSISYFSNDCNKVSTNILYFWSKGSLHWNIPLTWFTMNNESSINLTFLSIMKNINTPLKWAFKWRSKVLILPSINRYMRLSSSFLGSLDHMIMKLDLLIKQLSWYCKPNLIYIERSNVNLWDHQFSLF